MLVPVPRSGAAAALPLLLEAATHAGIVRGGCDVDAGASPTGIAGWVDRRPTAQKWLGHHGAVSVPRNGRDHCPACHQEVVADKYSRHRATATCLVDTRNGVLEDAGFVPFYSARMFDTIGDDPLAADMALYWPLEHRSFDVWRFARYGMSPVTWVYATYLRSPTPDADVNAIRTRTWELTHAGETLSGAVAQLLPESARLKDGTTARLPASALAAAPSDLPPIVSVEVEPDRWRIVVRCGDGEHEIDGVHGRVRSTDHEARWRDAPGCSVVIQQLHAFARSKQFGRGVDWVVAGIDFFEARWWRDFADITSVNEVIAWRNAGFSVTQARAWKAAKFHAPEEATPWRDVGLRPGSAAVLVVNGISVPDAQQAIGRSALRVEGSPAYPRLMFEGQPISPLTWDERD